MNCPICDDTGVRPAGDPSDDTFCSCSEGQRLRIEEAAWEEWKNPLQLD